MLHKNMCQVCAFYHLGTLTVSDTIGLYDMLPDNTTKKRYY